MASENKRDFWQRHIEGWRQSKLSQKAYCTQQDISFASFVSKLEKALSEKDQIILRQAKRIATLEEYVALGKFKKYGASSEKSPDQQEMFNEAELTVLTEEMLAESAQKAREPLPLTRKSLAASPCQRFTARAYRARYSNV